MRRLFLKRLLIFTSIFLVFFCFIYADEYFALSNIYNILKGLMIMWDYFLNPSFTHGIM